LSGHQASISEDDRCKNRVKVPEKQKWHPELTGYKGLKGKIRILMENARNAVEKETF
jgi:hypothetical protein